MPERSLSSPTVSEGPSTGGTENEVRASQAWITEAPIEPDRVLEKVGAPEDGAVLLFLGVVRNHNDGRGVSGLRYEAYLEMAEAVLGEIAREGADRLGGGRIAAVHRIGELAVGEVSVAVAVSSPHRAEGYEASRYVMEEIKKRLPIWKKERYADGGSHWLEGERPPVEGPVGEGRK